MQPLATPGTFMFQLPRKFDKESEAKKGITKRMLLHVCAEINFKELTISNMTFATPSNGMEVVLSHPRASRPTSLAGLIHQTLLMTKKQDHLSLSIRLKYLSIQMVGKTLVAHMPSGNFATDRFTTLNNKANSINPLAFLPQRNACTVEQMHMRDMIADMENSMGVLDAHKSKAIFPCDLPEKVCIQFCCRGQECKRDPNLVCQFLLPCSLEDLKLETIKLIKNYFLAKKVSWFKEYHFLKLPGLKPKCKALLGGKDGLPSKTA
jgi:hypothetical protein